VVHVAKTMLRGSWGNLPFDELRCWGEKFSFGEIALQDFLKAVSEACLIVDYRCMFWVVDPSRRLALAG